MNSKSNNPASQSMSFRATEYDAQRFKAQAVQSGKSFSDYTRDALINLEKYQKLEDLIVAMENRLIKRLFILNSAIAGLSDAEIAESTRRYNDLVKKKGRF